jgi:hypothetical protein
MKIWRKRMNEWINEWMTRLFIEQPRLHRVRKKLSKQSFCPDNLFVRTICLSGQFVCPDNFFVRTKRHLPQSRILPKTRPLAESLVACNWNLSTFSSPALPPLSTLWPVGGTEEGPQNPGLDYRCICPEILPHRRVFITCHMWSPPGGQSVSIGRRRSHRIPVSPPLQTEQFYHCHRTAGADLSPAIQLDQTYTKAITNEND